MLLGKLKPDLLAMCRGFLIGKAAALMPGSGLTLGRAQELHAPGFPRSFHLFFFLFSFDTEACVYRKLWGEGTEKLEGGQSRLIELVLNYTCIP